MVILTFDRSIADDSICWEQQPSQPQEVESVDVSGKSKA